MRLKYQGDAAVDIAVRDGVEPGEVVDVPDELAERLLFAGCQVDADGTVTAAAAPLWVRADTTKAAKTATEPAAAGKE